MTHDSLELVFVYNAESGLGAALRDTLAKLMTPATYQCKLCQLTYGPLTMKLAWRKYLKTLPYDLSFLHRDEFAVACPHCTRPLPAIFLHRGDEWHELVSAAKLNRCQSLEDIVSLVSRSLSAMTKERT